MPDQHSLFLSQPLNDPSNDTLRLSHLLSKYPAILKDAPFQRERVWRKSQIAGWAASIKSRDAIGVIVTYQLKEGDGNGNYIMYLLDGKQRLTSAIEIFDHPTKYDFLASDEVQMCLENFSIPVQHRQYKSHDEALRAFQNLNHGTAATPGEYYKGELTNTEHGAYIYEELNRIIMDAGSLVHRRELKIMPSTRSRYSRSALAVFYQYITKTTTVRFWGINTKEIKHGEERIEHLLSEWLENKTLVEVGDDFKSFKKFLEGQTAALRLIVNDVRDEGAAINVTVYRALMHLAIYRKNAKQSVDWQTSIFYWVIKLSKMGGGRLTYIYPGGDRATEISMGLGNLKWATTLSNTVGLDHPGSKTIRQPGPRTMEGNDNSHLQPFRDFGDGKTISEPTPFNRARGANPIEDDESDTE